MYDPQQASTPNAARAAAWRRYLRFWGPRAEADVDDELGFHIEMRAREYMARGMTEPDARRAAVLRLGNLAAARAECVAITSRRERRMTRAQLVDAFVHDVTFAWRTLGRQKGWTFVAVITLALGIGANTAVFSVVNTLLLHPLPYPDADRIAIIYQEPTRGNNTGMQVFVNPNPPLVRAWRGGSRAFEAIEPYHQGGRSMRTTEGTVSVVNTASILPSFTAFAGQRPALGRVFSDEEVARGDRVAMIGEPFWRARLGSDPRIIGKPITIDQQPYTIVGVMPATFRLPRLAAEPSDVWLPLDLRDDNTGLSVIGRLRPGVTRADATRELDGIATPSAVLGSKTADFTTKLTPPSELVRFRASLVMLTGAVALVLLIACGNVTHLVMARTATRERELAIRTALGASRLRLVRQLLTESLILAAAGCAGGLLAGWLGLQVLVAMRPDNLPELIAARIDGTTLLVTAALSVATGLVVGVLGAIQTARHSAHDALKAGALSASQSRRQRRLRSLVVASEMTVSMVLLVGAMLLVRSMLHLNRIEPGFDAAGLHAVEIALPKTHFSAPGAGDAFVSQVADRVRRIPGVEMATVAAGAPPSRSFMIGGLHVEGEPEPPRGTTSFIDYNGIEPNYFSTMRMRIIAGSTLTDTTDAGAQVVVNEGLAQKYWPGKSALGRRLRVVFNGQGEWKTIVGVAADAFTGGLTSEAAAPTLYMASRKRFQAVLILRAAPGRNPIPTVNAIVAQLDPTLPPPKISNIETAMARSIAGPRFTMVLLVAFTVLALVLAAVGLYGVMAYSVAQRTREIGIRIALGATRRDVARAILWQGTALALVGAVVGLFGARWGSKLLEHMLYGVSRSDAASFALGGLVLVGTAMLACIVPMRRAVSVDPLVAIRAD
jgi:putative ABC transport system permease protein